MPVTKNDNIFFESERHSQFIVEKLDYKKTTTRVVNFVVGSEVIFTESKLPYPFLPPVILMIRKDRGPFLF